MADDDVRCTCGRMQGHDGACPRHPLVRDLTDARARIAELEGAERHLGNLLARIHRDGGDYAAAVGIDRAVQDADVGVATLYVERDELKARVERLGGAFNEMLAQRNAATAEARALRWAGEGAKGALAAMVAMLRNDDFSQCNSAVVVERLKALRHALATPAIAHGAAMERLVRAVDEMERWLHEVGRREGDWWTVPAYLVCELRDALAALSGTTTKEMP